VNTRNPTYKASTDFFVWEKQPMADNGTTDGGQSGTEKSPKLTVAQSVRVGFPIGVGIGIGIMTRDAAQASLGWLSAPVCMLTAGASAVATAYLLSLWRPRN
jgi:hypothetical protein